LLGVAGCGGRQAALEHPCAPSGGRPLATPALVRIADAHRDLGLRKLARDEPAGEDLKIATTCYAAAQALAPDSYAANLGMGVTYLARAKKIRRPQDKTRRSYLTAAKRALGQAYLVRQGPYEPLYYLAEVAALENDNRAAAFITAVEDAGVKTSPVYALKGYLAYRTSRLQAEEHWNKALEAGWPEETLRYAADPEEGRPGAATLIAGSVLVGSSHALVTAAGGLRASRDASGASIPFFVVAGTASAIGLPLLVHGAAARSVETGGGTALLAGSGALLAASPGLIAGGAAVASDNEPVPATVLIGVGGSAAVAGIPLLVHGAVQTSSGGEGAPGVANLIGGSVLAATVPAFVVPGVVVGEGGGSSESSGESSSSAPAELTFGLIATGATAGTTGIVLLIQGAVEAASGDGEEARRWKPEHVVVAGVPGLGWEF
jgi:hypothetical protein